MFHELDVVALTEDVPTAGLVKGNVGTIVQSYTAEDYEVEFVDNDGQTYGLATLKSAQLIRLQFAPTAVA